MGPILALIIIASVSLLIVRMGAIALARTGLSSTTADFQATSAFFGVGFTTSEAELVVGHPVRRRIVRDLIIAGNIGLTGALAAIIVTFASDSGDSGMPWTTKLVIAVATIAAVILAAKLGVIRRALDAVVGLSLRSAGVDRPLDYEVLMQLGDGYAVLEVDVPQGHWLHGKTLAQTRLGSMGVLILGVRPIRGAYIGAPDAATTLSQGDHLTVYGREAAVEDLAELPHATFVERHAGEKHLKSI
ncbi:MAG: TrkA C-terminal domain-containing protein [Planctomycetota bacterium]